MEHEKKKIAVIADDDPVISEVLKKFLSSLCEVVQVSDETTLMERYKEHNPDIIFLDIHMPTICGLDLVKEIRAHDKDAFIVMLTADATADNVTLAKNMGVNGFLAKPFTKESVTKNFYRSMSVSHQNPSPTGV